MSNQWKLVIEVYNFSLTRTILVPGMTRNWAYVTTEKVLFSHDIYAKDDKIKV